MVRFPFLLLKFRKPIFSLLTQLRRDLDPRAVPSLGYGPLYSCARLSPFS